MPNFLSSSVLMSRWTQPANQLTKLLGGVGHLSGSPELPVTRDFALRWATWVAQSSSSLLHARPYLPRVMLRA
ncbi:hypothetical protein N798_00225 [Knoellia flava TL1]|uniref:Uncharacterized protein n=1 Tax=Knoellia flava TL1 TaxID=1385518 RepID=A0ABR4XIH3_9MICO|nr:hypothetical protein N798_00225 [Knoellia flava TL1]